MLAAVLFARANPRLSSHWMITVQLFASQFDDPVAAAPRVRVNWLRQHRQGIGWKVLPVGVTFYRKRETSLLRRVRIGLCIAFDD